MSDHNFLMDAESLCSKWGFGDGDAFDDWWWDTYDEDAPANSDDILHALVLEYLVPAMRAANWFPVLCRIETIHNPVRAESLNGAGVDWYDGEYPNFDPPIQGSVTREQVEQVVQRLTPIEQTQKPGDPS
jgi:hypothetical protein